MLTSAQPDIRIAALSDVHGNLLALEAVVADLRQHSPDVIVNLGDHVSGPLEPAAVADLLMTLPATHIRGNHERQLLERDTEDLGPSDRFAAEQLDLRHWSWIKAQETGGEIVPGVLACHGSLESDTDYLVEEILAGKLVLRSTHALERELAAVSGEVILCGHTHVPRVVRTLSGKLIVNPGSVGLPAFDNDRPTRHAAESGSPHAKYALLDRKAGKWSVGMYLVVYDWHSAARTATENGRPDWAQALLTGRISL